MGFKIMLCATTALQSAINAIGQAIVALKEDSVQTARVLGLIGTWQKRQSIVESESLMDREIYYDQIVPGEE